MPIIFESSSKAFLPQSTAPSVVVPAPTGIVKGDLLVALGLVNQAGAVIVSASNGLVILTQNSPPVAGSPKAFVATKTATDNEPASYIFSHGLAGNGAWNVGILRFSGACGVEQPIAPNTVDNLPGALITAPSIVTIKDKDLIVRAFLFDTTGTEPSSVTPSAGMTLREAILGPQPPFSSDPQGHIFTDDALVTPAGPTGTATLTLVGFVGNVKSVQYTLALEEIPTGSGGLLGEPMTRQEVMERSMRVPIPKGTRLKNPVRRIKDPWKELTRK